MHKVLKQRDNAQCATKQSQFIAMLWLSTARRALAMQVPIAILENSQSALQSLHFSLLLAGPIASTPTGPASAQPTLAWLVTEHQVTMRLHWVGSSRLFMQNMRERQWQ